MEIKKTLVVYAKPETKEDRLTLSKIKEVLGKLKINSVFVKRNRLKGGYFKNKYLVITVGGDGTFLKASHFLKNKHLIFGINSDIKMKEGFFLVADRRDFEKKIGRILNGKFKIKKFARLEARINNKKIPELALNEFYIGSEKEYTASRYYIKLNGNKERQKSSGILVATPAGSNAWIKSCGGRKLKLGERKFEYVVREPYEGSLSGKYRMKKGILGKNKKLILISDMKKGMLVVDSLGKEHFFNKKDKVSVGMSNKDLEAVFF